MAKNFCKWCGDTIFQTTSPAWGRIWLHSDSEEVNCPPQTVATPGFY